VEYNITIYLNKPAIKGVFNGNFSAILLPEKSTHDRTRLLSESVPCNVVGYGQKDEGVECYLESAICRLLGRDERVVGYLDSHYD
jgi:hypothetical protein